jgi:hypothetical protein
MPGEYFFILYSFMDMKKLLLALLLFCSISARAQQGAIFLEKMNVFYIGVPNPIKVTVEKYDCRDVVIQMEGARFEPKGLCRFDAYFEKPGRLNLRILVKDAKTKKMKVVEEYPFRIKFIPDPVASVAGKPFGKLPVEIFKAADSIATQVQCFDFDVSFPVTSFNIAVSKDDKEVFASKTTGNKFDEATKNYFDRLATGDTISITNVHAISPDKEDRQLSDMIFIMK